MSEKNATNKSVYQIYYGLIIFNFLSDETTKETLQYLKEKLSVIDEYVHFHDIQENYYAWQVRVNLSDSKSQAEIIVQRYLQKAFSASEVKNVDVAIHLSLQYLSKKAPDEPFANDIDYNILRSSEFDIDSVMKPVGAVLLHWESEIFRQL